MDNKFFSMALRRAAMIAGKRTRLLLLISQLVAKLRAVNWKNVKASNVKEKFFILGRLVKAYANGQYRGIPWKSLLVITAAIIYFISPLDLLPDFIPVTGLTDDFGVLLWVYNSLNTEIDKFLTWEKSQVTT
ncbi:MAG: YkvA family protein [Bacteroidota bacterium]